jgi:phospholipase/carboxylesterase
MAEGTMDTENEGAEALAQMGRLGARPRPAVAAAPGPAGEQPLGLDVGRDGLIYVPEDLAPGRPVPLVLLLHGAGGDARQMLTLLRVAADARGLVLLAPESRGRTWDLILQDYGPDVRFIDRALAAAFERQAVDPKRLAIGGFSDGGSYALSLGLSNGGLFGHILAFSPGFMAPTRVEDSPRFFISHGTADRVLPIDRTSRQVVGSLQQFGYEVEYREYSGGHVVPPDIALAAVDWFLAGLALPSPRA